MGYQNNNRPKKLKLLLLDAVCDIGDVKEDIKNGVDVIEALNFIKKTLNKIRKKL